MKKCISDIIIDRIDDIWGLSSIMDKRIRDRLRRIEKLEIELLSDEELINEKKELLILIKAVQNELVRKMILIAAIIVGLAVSLTGLFSYPSAPMLGVVLVFVLLFIASIMIYYQKNSILEELYKASDLLTIKE